MSKLESIYWVFALGMLCGCPPTPGPDPIPGASCEAAEARLAELRCVQDGVELWQGFAEACRIDAEDGVDAHAECITALPSCEYADAAWKGEWCAP